MKFRQKFAALLAALMLATSLPTFAASTNGVNKIITIAKGTQLEGSITPELKIELKDHLAKDQTFYLDLENAEWARDAADKLNEVANLKADFKFSLVNEKQLAVKVINADGIEANEKTHRIPMFTRVTGGDAAVTIDSNDTVVTSGKYVFAISNNAVAAVTVADAKSFATTGQMADITIEESHIGAFQSSTQDHKVRFEIEGTNAKFNYIKDLVIPNALVGSKSYAGKTYDVTVIDSTTLEATIPKGELTGNQRGAFTLEGIELKADKDAPYGDVKVRVSGHLNETVTLVVAKHRDYGTDLEVAKEYTARAGQELKDVEFTLSETVMDSISASRETLFTFSEGLTIKEVTVSKSSGITAGKDAPLANPVKEDGKNTNAFTVKSIEADKDQKTSVTFKATLDVPAAFTGDIKLTLEGRALEKEKEIEIAKVSAPVEVGVTPARVQVGLAKQEAGTVLIKEMDKGMLSAGKIFLAMDDSDFAYSVAPEVKVLEGNLKVDAEAEIVKGGLEITVTSKSTKASTLEISGGELHIDAMVPQGTYAVKVGGPAISAYSNEALWNNDKKKHNDIDEIAEKDFLYIGTTTQAAKVAFVIGQDTYTKDGVEITMDTAAYISQGRTMLPVRYVSDALGIDSKAILWDNTSKTVTVLGDRIIQIKLGSKEMLINGASVPMTAAAEMKNSRVFIPVAEIARALNADVAWDDTSKTATFN